jgi:hypothetical protein
MVKQNKLTQIMEENKLANYLKFSLQTLKIYMCRPEFCHVERVKVARGKYLYKGITSYDLERLKELRSRPRSQMCGARLR